MAMSMMRPAQYALKLAEEKGYTFIHPFDDLDVATGQSTVAMEILKDLPFVDYYLSASRWWRTCHRCIDACQDAQSKHQGNRCRASRSSLLTGIP